MIAHKAPSLTLLALLTACQQAPADPSNASGESTAATMLADSTLRAVEARCIACEDLLLRKFGAGDTSGWSECLVDGLLEHTTLPSIVSHVGIQGLKERVLMDHTAFPDLHYNVLSRSVEGDVSFVHYNMKGVNTGPVGPVPPTGKSIDINGVMVMRWQNGKAVEHWDYPDIALLMRQLSPATDLSSGKQ